MGVTYTLQRYQREAGTPEKAADFIKRAIVAHQQSEAYQDAQTARKYYNGQNVTITERQNLLYDAFGKAYKDVWTPNNKLKSRFFRNAVDQRVSYLLAADGVSFANPETKKKLSTPKARFDTQVFIAASEAFIGGTSYSFFNHNHIDVFPFENFAAIPDEDDGSMKMGIRYWRLADDTPLITHLFEMDGYSVFREDAGGQLVLSAPKRPYRQQVTSSAMSEEIAPGAPYPGFPIVPLSCNRIGTSLLNGCRDTIDALDIARSTSVNHVDSDIVYWLFEGYGGMNDFDIVKAIADLRRCHGLATQAMGQSGAHITPHTVQAPFEGLNITIEEIKRQLNSDFSVFDPQLITASSDTATAIRAAYEPLNVSTNVFEFECLTPYISQILELAEIEDEFSFKRDAVTNKQEEMQTLLLLAPYVDAEYIREMGMAILGDADRFDEVSRRMDAEAAARLSSAGADEDETEETQ